MSDEEKNLEGVQEKKKPAKKSTTTARSTAKKEAEAPAKPKRTTSRKKMVDEESSPKAPKKAAVKKAPAKKSVAKKSLDVEEVPRAVSDEEWSPKGAQVAPKADRPKLERPQLNGDEDIPTSFKVSPDDKPEPRREPAEQNHNERGGEQQEGNESNDNRGGRGRNDRSRNNSRNDGRNDRNGRDGRDSRNDRDSRDGRNDRNSRERNDRGRNNNRNDNRNGRNDRDSRHDRGGRNDRHNNNNRQQNNNRNNNNNQQKHRDRNAQKAEPVLMSLSNLPQWEILAEVQAMEAKAQEIAVSGEVFNLNEILALSSTDLLARARELGVEWEGAPLRDALVKRVLEAVFSKNQAIVVEGVVDILAGDAVVVFGEENYRVKPISPYLPKALINKYMIERGTIVKVQLHPALEETQSQMSMVLKVLSIMGEAPESNLAITPFEEQTPYYPTKRILLETHPDVKWDNFSMRITDLLTPIGFGQRGLIVAPPRTGKTVLMQGIANAISENHPEAHLIILLVDERPEEVTDFKRQIKAEVVASTFDETPLSHVHSAEIVIEKARRMAERGKDVVILLDSITRLARAYNAMMPSSGKIMSGGVESNALQKPKRFFGSARNIEEGGSLTILGTALVDTGSKMDEVIFEEFKGTGNMELHLDRGLVDKRLFPAIALDKSGTRKEELLYHPDEMLKVYGLRRAMKGISPLEAMEMLIARVKKTRTNIEFLMGLSR